MFSELPIYRGVPVELGLGALAGGGVTVVLELVLAQDLVSVYKSLGGGWSEQGP